MFETIIAQKSETANTFNARFVVRAQQDCIEIEPEREYAARLGGREAVALTGTGHLIRIASERGVLHADPGEALQLAAALQAVAVDLLEQQPRQIKRCTEPGQPDQDGIGGGL